MPHATPPSASGDSSGPAPWPGVSAPAPRADGYPDGNEQADHDGEVPFWDWAPSEDSADMRFSLDEDPDAGPPGVKAATPAAAGPAGPAGPAAPARPAGPREPGRPGASAEPVVTPVETADGPPPKEGIGHRFGRLDHIFGDTRMGVWRRRAIIAIFAGVLFTILTNWRIGLTLAVVAAIADTIYRSRVVAPPRPGIKMTKAQRLTARQLAKLERSGYKTLHSRLIPETDDHIDHLVIGPAGVFSIDSEAWDKHLPIRTKNARQLWHGPFSMKDRLEHARWESERAAEYVTSHAEPALLQSLPGGTVSVRPAMAVYGPKIPWDIATIRDVDVFSGGRLRTYLRRYARTNHARPLSQTQIDQIYRAAHGAFPNHDPGLPAQSPFE